jgi:hypothetical protein
VWHFYQIFLDPDSYPMNWAWWDGKMSFDHYHEEHGLDTATLQSAVEAERRTREEDPPAADSRAIGDERVSAEEEEQVTSK